MIDRLILGDNAFFGIHHRSVDAGKERANFFRDPEKILEVMRQAHAHGARGVMLSAHESVPLIVRRMQKDPVLGRDFSVYPNIPYLMKYVSQSTKNGLGGTLLNLALSQSPLENARHLARGTFGLLTKDFYQWLGIGLDLELSKYRGAKLGAVFLHNGITDLLLGLGAKDPFLFFDEYIRKRYKTSPAFGTLNLERLYRFLSECGLKDPIIMAPFNKTGFHMNPSRESSEKVVGEGGFTLLAMNVLVSGALSPREAFEYLGRFPNIRHVIIGASHPEHVSESFGLAKKVFYA